MIADMLSNKKPNPMVTVGVIYRGRKLNIYLAFITKSYFAVPKNVRLNSTHQFIMKIPNKQELQFSYLSDIDLKDLMNRYKKYSAKPYSSLVTDATPA